MGKRKRHPEHTGILGYLDINGLRKDFVCKKLSISPSFFSQILHGIRPMPDRILNQINVLFDTNFTQPEPTPEIFPHEQDALDRQSLQEKPLFKDQVD